MAYPGDGQFGPVFDDIDRSDWHAVVARLREQQTGEVPAALFHPKLGLIDAVWGKAGTGRSDGYGLAKIVQYHREVLDDLPAILRNMTIARADTHKVQLHSATHEAGVRLDWYGERKTWLITAYERRPDTSPATDDGRAAGAAQAGSFPGLEAETNIAKPAADAKGEARRVGPHRFVRSRPA